MPVPFRRLASGTILVDVVARDAEQRVVLYARVWSHDQRSELQRQVAWLTQWATGNGQEGYQFALDPTPAQAASVADSHAGAARFAYNTMLAAVKANLDQRRAERYYGIDEGHLTPAMGWAFQSLRNDFNRRKHRVAIRGDGTPWWPQNSKEVYANGCRDLSQALSNWDASRNGTRHGPSNGVPQVQVETRGSQEVLVHHRHNSGGAGPQACDAAPTRHDQDAREHPQVGSPHPRRHGPDSEGDGPVPAGTLVGVVGLPGGARVRPAGACETRCRGGGHRRGGQGPARGRRPRGHRGGTLSGAARAQAGAAKTAGVAPQGRPPGRPVG